MAQWNLIAAKGPSTCLRHLKCHRVLIGGIGGEVVKVCDLAGAFAKGWMRRGNSDAFTVDKDGAFIAAEIIEILLSRAHCVGCWPFLFIGHSKLAPGFDRFAIFQKNF